MISVKSGTCRDFERCVLSTLGKYALADKKEKIIIALSGGKDSTSLAFILKKSGYFVEAVHIDMGLGDYSRKSREVAVKFCNAHQITLHVVDFRKEMGFDMNHVLENFRDFGLESPCAACGTMKKYLLNRHSRMLGASRLATGHNMDDECQSMLMNIFRASPAMASRIGPLVKTRGDEMMVPRIKPLFFCTEAAVSEYCKKMRFIVKRGICPYSRSVYRRRIKNALDRLENMVPGSKKSMLLNAMSLRAASKSKDSGMAFRCSRCNEPSSRNVCRACTLSEKLLGRGAVNFRKGKLSRK